MPAHNNLPRWAMMVDMVKVKPINSHLQNSNSCLWTREDFESFLFRSNNFMKIRLNTSKWTLTLLLVVPLATMTELLLFAALGNLIASRQAFSEQRSVTVGATNKSAKERFTHLLLPAMNDQCSVQLLFHFSNCGTNDDWMSRCSEGFCHIYLGNYINVLRW